MSHATDARQLLGAAHESLEEVSRAFAVGSDPEELAHLQQAIALGEEADRLAAAAAAAESEQMRAELYRRAHECALQAEHLRHLVAETLRGRAAVADQAEQTAKETQGGTEQAVAGTTAGDAIVTQVAGIVTAAGEVKTHLLAAAEMAPLREQTAACTGLIVQAAERSTEICGLCQQTQQAITEYSGRL